MIETRTKTRDRYWYRHTFVTILCLLLTAISCNSAPETPTEEHFEIVKELERGPLAFTIKLDRKELTIADQLSLVLEVKAKEQYEVQLPDFGDKLERFGIVDYHSTSPRLIEEDLVLYRKSYILEPFLSGIYTIPPMKVIFWNKEDEESKKHELESEEISLTVKSLLPEEMAEHSIKEIVPPLDLPSQGKLWLYVSIGATLLTVAAIGLALLIKKRQPQQETYRLSADELAYQQLEALLREKLVEQGEIKLFYLHLSSVLRHYIENRFGLRAPERTTEEFLRELSTSKLLAPMHKDLLATFLQHCDMVKFAEHNPSNEEIQKTFDSCKQVIMETRSKNDIIEDKPVNSNEYSEVLSDAL